MHYKNFQDGIKLREREKKTNIKKIKIRPNILINPNWISNKSGKLNFKARILETKSGTPRILKLPLLKIFKKLSKRSWRKS